MPVRPPGRRNGCEGCGSPLRQGAEKREYRERDEMSREAHTDPFCPLSRAFCLPGVFVIRWLRKPPGEKAGRGARKEGAPGARQFSGRASVFCANNAEMADWASVWI
ncbi:hypothetical protein AA21291_1008 [Swaminathania salitolerans LMG 21291]|uniref:Uncharacterized protein n=1 Tax=Swaminathania salitolerans TaxID=182838 RepID=A0A511BQP1_9PROT|nr:hypothetical protein AA21291_1008 [Swaminathania salitolerans LMG 21291]GEL02667.1 hypothetical protein SSA02_18300 [Swaminathania salitolerans]